MTASAVGLVLLVDRPDLLGRADARVDDTATIELAVATLRAARPEAPIFVVRTITDAEPIRRAPPVRRDRPCRVHSAFHTDARRLDEMRAERFQHLLVARPAIAEVPPGLVRGALVEAARRRADLLRIDGVPDDVGYVASAGLLRDVLTLGAVPTALTLPDVVDRLQRARPDTSLPWHLVGGPTARTGSGRDVGATVMAGHGSDAPLVLPSASREVLVALPSPYQTGAHFAWRALLDHLDASRVGFVVARGTLLARELAARGFEPMLVGPGWLTSPRAEREWKAALAALRPRVVHLDGAECAPLAGAVTASDIRVVAHVRLTTIERFLPLCAQVETVVAVSSLLRERLAEQLGDATEVMHVPDGVRLVDPRSAPAVQDGPVRVLCVGRVEPSKDQLRVLDIVDAVAACRPCELRLVGPCGNDVAYADEVTSRLRALPATARAVWVPFTDPMAPHYDWADVVLVASRNEALGMVGLEALAAGRLLVAQRSSGYAEIIDEDAGEGLLFDREEPAPRIAARIDEALTTYAAYADAARHKARTHFDARLCAARLGRIWNV